MEWNKKNIPREIWDLSWIPKALNEVSLSPLSLIPFQCTSRGSRKRTISPEICTVVLGHSGTVVKVTMNQELGNPTVMLQSFFYFWRRKKKKKESKQLKKKMFSMVEILGLLLSRHTQLSYKVTGLCHCCPSFKKSIIHFPPRWTYLSHYIPVYWYHYWWLNLGLNFRIPWLIPPSSKCSSLTPCPGQEAPPEQQTPLSYMLVDVRPTNFLVLDLKLTFHIVWSINSEDY